MWMDKTGRAITVALEDPSVVVEPALQQRFFTLPPSEVRRVLDSLEGYLPSILEEHATLTWNADQEAAFKDMELPAGLTLIDHPNHGMLDNFLIEQLDAIPIRWRIDVADAVMQFLHSDVLPDVDGILRKRLHIAGAAGLAALLLTGLFLFAIQKRGQ